MQAGTHVCLLPCPLHFVPTPQKVAQMLVDMKAKGVPAVEMKVRTLCFLVLQGILFHKAVTILNR